jgi:hypothetical protein
MPSLRRTWIIAAGVAVTLAAIASPALAQGKSQGKSHKGRPPSSSPLPAPSVGGAAVVSAASPLAWLDDASVLTPGAVSVGISAARWSGAGASEVDVPIVDAGLGIAPRVQIGASLPRIAPGPNGSEPLGGLGTSYFSGKVALLTGSALKLALSPLVEVLGTSAAQTLPAGSSRLQFGLPISVELEQGSARVFASTGFFSRGALFAGGGAGFQATPTVGVSIAFTRSWVNDEAAAITRDRRELSGGMSWFVRPPIALYGSVGRTIATSDEDGAGRTVSGGITFLLTPGPAK